MLLMHWQIIKTLCNSQVKSAMIVDVSFPVRYVIAFYVFVMYAYGIFSEILYL